MTCEQLRIKITDGVVTVKKTKNPNANCIICDKRFYSYAKSLGFEDSCPDCKVSDVQFMNKFIKRLGVYHDLYCKEGAPLET